MYRNITILCALLAMAGQAMAVDTRLSSSEESKYFIEAGYARVASANSNRHFETVGIDPIMMKNINIYQNRHFKDSDGFYLGFGIQPHVSWKVGIQYLQTGYNEMDAINNLTVNTTTHILSSYRLQARQQVGLVHADYHFAMWDRIRPYVGAGLGLAYHSISRELVNLCPEITPELDAVRTSTSSTRLAWGLRAGLQYTLSKDTYLHVGYQYLDLGTIKGTVRELDVNASSSSTPSQVSSIPPNLKGRVTQHVFMVGVGYQF